MLRKLSAALLATALIAGPALAATPAADTTSTPAAHTASAPAKHAKVLRHRAKKIKVAHHLKRTKTHRSHIAVHKGKPAKAVKTGKVHNTGKTSKTSKANKPVTGTHG